MQGRSNRTGQAADKRTRINEEIQAEKVRLLDYDGNQKGIVSLEEALRLTEEAENETGLRLDLIEIAPLVSPPVCQMADYSKYIFEQKKKKVLQQKKQKRTKLKEIKLRPVTEQNDYDVKRRHLISFLQENDRVKVSVRFRGREMEHRDLGQELLQRLIRDIEPYGKVEVPAKAEGRQMIMVIVPKK
jgi:translation initiation factor IF-3